MSSLRTAVLAATVLAASCGVDSERVDIWQPIQEREAKDNAEALPNMRDVAWCGNPGRRDTEGSNASPSPNEVAEGDPNVGTFDSKASTDGWLSDSDSEDAGSTPNADSAYLDVEVALNESLNDVAVDADAGVGCTSAAANLGLPPDDYCTFTRCEHARCERDECVSWQIPFACADLDPCYNVECILFEGCVYTPSGACGD